MSALSNWHGASLLEMLCDQFCLFTLLPRSIIEICLRLKLKKNCVPVNDDSERDVLIFEGALHLPMAERADYLERACAGNADLRHRVEVLLRAHENAGDFLRDPA